MPQSNGQAEKFVDTFKRTFTKLKGEELPAQILDTFLVTYRTTPCPTLNGKCPAELFLGRRPRTTLDLLRPPPKMPTSRDEQMESQFNRKHGAKERNFSVGDAVFARHSLSQEWRPGKVISRRGVIYEVEFVNGMSNRFHTN
jgi:hypothetical protein